MKGKRTFAYLALLCLLIALAMPLAAAADGCPPENPHCNIEPPQSIEVNTDPLHADGSPVELPEPGALSPQLIPMPLPRNVDPLPLPAGDASSFETLPIPMRYQDPDDTTCGVHALGMVLSGLGEDAPSSAAIQSFLENNGMMYDFGTGVEELAYAAQSLGYKGSLPFHDWTLENLQAELSAGRPVVVSLGANPGQNTGTSGEGVPGHFVTVTGISNGQVAYNDPTLGKQVISTEEFLRLWSIQGSSGVAVGMESPLPGLDLMPWVAFLAGLMALITQTPLLHWRRGIGGRLDPGVGTAIPQQPPPVYVPPPRPAPVYVAPAPAPAAVDPVTEGDRLTQLQQQLDPVILPKPTPEEVKLTRIEQQLDPVIPPDSNDPQHGSAEQSDFVSLAGDQDSQQIYSSIFPDANLQFQGPYGLPLYPSRTCSYPIRNDDYCWWMALRISDEYSIDFDSLLGMREAQLQTLYQEQRGVTAHQIQSEFDNSIYSEWNNGDHSGCYMCHVAVADQTVRATNPQFRIADENAPYAFGAFAEAMIFAPAFAYTINETIIPGYQMLRSQAALAWNRFWMATSRTSEMVQGEMSPIYQHYGTELPIDVRVTFRGWNPSQVEYAPGTQVYRIHTPASQGGNISSPWWSPSMPLSEIQFRIDSAVLPQWNTAGEFSILTVPEGQTLMGWEGLASYYEGFYIGGGTQIYLPRVPEDWIRTYGQPWP